MDQYLFSCCYVVVTVCCYIPFLISSFKLLFLSFPVNFPYLLLFCLESKTYLPTQLVTDIPLCWIVVVQLLLLQLFASSCAVVCHALLSSTISQSLPKFMCIELVMLSNHLIFCHSLLLPSIYPSIFSNESALCIR